MNGEHTKRVEALATDLVTVEKEGDGWRVKASGWGSFPIADRNTVTHAFDLARFCYDKGREDAFSALRALIGVDHG